MIDQVVAVEKEKREETCDVFGSHVNGPYWYIGMQW